MWKALLALFGVGTAVVLINKSTKKTNEREEKSNLVEYNKVKILRKNLPDMIRWVEDKNSKIPISKNAWTYKRIYQKYVNGKWVDIDKTEFEKTWFFGYDKNKKTAYRISPENLTKTGKKKFPKGIYTLILDIEK